nr:MAG: polyprotein 2 [Rousettus madagascariensis nepovirus]
MGFDWAAAAAAINEKVRAATTLTLDVVEQAISSASSKVSTAFLEVVSPYVIKEIPESLNPAFFFPSSFSSCCVESGYNTSWHNMKFCTFHNLPVVEERWRIPAYYRMPAYFVHNACVRCIQERWRPFTQYEYELGRPKIHDLMCKYYFNRRSKSYVCDRELAEFHFPGYIELQAPTSSNVGGSHTQTIINPYREQNSILNSMARARENHERRRRDQQESAAAAAALRERGAGVGITADHAQATRAYQNAHFAQPVRDSILPRRGQIYGRRGWFGRRELSTFETTRTVRSVLVDAGFITAAGEASSVIEFNPVSPEELVAFRNRGATSYFIDQLEIAIVPYGMPGDDTNFSVVAMWGHEDRFERAWLGTVSSFLGNGFASVVLNPGLHIPYTQPNQHRTLRFFVGSTNSTRQADTVLASLRVSTNIQHVGVGELWNRNVSQDLVDDQIHGRQVRTSLLGNTVVYAPEGGPVQGVPDVDIQIPGTVTIRNTGPSSFEVVESSGHRFNVTRALTRSLSTRVQGSDRRAPVSQLPRQETEPLPRHEGPDRNYLQGDLPISQLATVEKIVMPQDMQEGKVIGFFDFISSVSSFAGVVFREWQMTHIFNCDIVMEVSFASNPFVGASFVIIPDFGNRLPLDVHTIPLDILGTLPHFVVSLSEPSPKMFNVDMEKLRGVPLTPYPRVDGDTRFVVVAANTNSLTTTNSWDVFIRFHATNRVPVLSPEVTPHISSCFNWNGEVERLYSPLSFSLGENTPKFVGLNFGDLVQSSTWKTKGYYGALASNYLGFGGEVIFEVFVVSSCFIKCELLAYVHCGGAIHNIRDICRVPHIQISGPGVYSLKICSPYITVPTKVVSQEFFGKIYFQPICGPVAPKDTVGKFEILVDVKKIDKFVGISKPVPTDSYIGWFNIQSIRSDDLKLHIPMNVGDFSIKGMTVVMVENPFSRMLASSLYHEGTVSLQFTWSLEQKFGDVKGFISFAVRYGPSEDSESVGLYHVSTAVPVCTQEIKVHIGSFVGGEFGGKTLNFTPYVRIRSNIGTKISNINICIKPSEDFKLKGMTNCPIKSVIKSESDVTLPSEDESSSSTSEVTEPPESAPMLERKIFARTKR